MSIYIDFDRDMSWKMFFWFIDYIYIDLIVRAMSEPSDALTGQLEWAKSALTFLGKGQEDVLLWQGRPLGTSSMFSGSCYPEHSLSFINAARETGE